MSRLSRAPRSRPHRSRPCVRNDYQSHRHEQIPWTPVVVSFEFVGSGRVAMVVCLSCPVSEGRERSSTCMFIPAETSSPKSLTAISAGHSDFVVDQMLRDTMVNVDREMQQVITHHTVRPEQSLLGTVAAYAHDLPRPPNEAHEFTPAISRWYTHSPLSRKLQ
ncbi:hypothetical protein GY45DRAFT_1328636 [Cubamyces sp. BRFM 1775]|nr:hypothetical protein GY45DRAFT_1328636 [Cubamyces sp. BRFM 1775]